MHVRATTLDYVLPAPQASMLEIYMEEIKDLLGKGPPAGKIVPPTPACKLQDVRNTHQPSWLCSLGRAVYQQEGVA